MTRRARLRALASGLDPERATRVAPYDLRHARITALAEVGATRGAVQLLAGHRHAATTERYLHPLQGAARVALGLLAGAQCAPAGKDCKGRRIGSAIGSAVISRITRGFEKSTRACRFAPCASLD